jgi:hypothetical protein
MSALVANGSWVPSSANYWHHPAIHHEPKL